MNWNSCCCTRLHLYNGCSVSASVRRRGYISRNAPRRGPDDMSTSQDWQTRLDLAQRAGLRIGLWNWDLAANTVIWSDESYRQWGFTRQTFSGRIEDALTRVHPGDRLVVEEAIRAAHAGAPEYAAQYRIVRPDQTTCWIDGRGAPWFIKGRLIR